MDERGTEALVGTSVGSLFEEAEFMFPAGLGVVFLLRRSLSSAVSEISDLCEEAEFGLTFPAGLGVAFLLC